ncbi:hypothetical protein Poli38472_012182 [Pythium oligandrum]|uniref:RING-type domain-containing protein n=1 Tax=Pythium oligandrum TaxID=41045 RepID=A0A8K1FLF1_PYTOL|nr:hypothetical protein Poli38472_012182 [Pythium oligandrum]|eukprot:TMW67066.1 hypothetical protein Poli38472_012182 [Pythium oligandrum]
MGFRGVLLKLSEGEADELFRVVCPDASLQIPTVTTPAQNQGTGIAEQKMVVVDQVTALPQQVTRLSSVLPQPRTRSAFWVVTQPAATAGEEEEEEEAPMAGSVRVFARGAPPLTRVCYCFYFQSEIEYELFARVCVAASRLQQYDMLERSVLMELEIKKNVEIEREEIKRAKEARSRASLAAVASARPQRNPPVASRRQGPSEPERSRPRPTAVTTDEMAARLESGRSPRTASQSPVVASEPVSSQTPHCILCGTEANAGRAGTLIKHPFVLKDAKGEAVLVCKICMQGVLKRRVQNDAGLGTSTANSVCGLCSEAMATTKTPPRKCAHPQCQRSYCSPCLRKLVGKAQTKKVWRMKNWYCPNCTDLEGKPTVNENPTPLPQQPVVTPREADTPSKKKRKRRNEIVDDDESTASSSPSRLATAGATNQVMTIVDYAATYYEFLSERESQRPPPEESEDVCFCCKDGGDVLECDYNEGNRKCPKVYHQDCLGFTVPDNVNWICPRHRCFACGFQAPYSCRFCVTSFCEEHFPKDIKKLGKASGDLPDVQYVLCGGCDKMSLRAVEDDKLSSKVYDRVVHGISHRARSSKASR